MARLHPVLCALVLLLVPLLAGCLGAGQAAVPPAANASPDGTLVPNATHGATMTNTTATTLVFRDPDLSFELLRTIAKALGHGADIGESLETLRIAAHEPEGLRPVLDAWYREWNATAGRIHAIGVESEARNHMVSAGEAYLRASEYYRVADFFLHDDPANPEIVRLWDAMHADFVRGLTLTGVRFEEVEVPYGNTTSTVTSSRPTPTAAGRRRS